jgi:hypothetical protein
MRIDGDVAMTLAAQISYIDQQGLTGKVLGKSIRKNNTATRQLQENGWRSIDLHEVLRKLDVHQNKFLILRLLPRMDLFEILYLLGREELINGLFFFDRERLLFLLMHLPKRMIIQMMLQVFSLQYLIRELPTREIFAILTAKKLTMREFMRAFEYMPMKFLHQILSKMFRQDMSKFQKPEIMEIFKNSRKRNVVDAMRMLPFKALQPFVYHLIQEDPELLMLLSPQFISKMMDRLPKRGLIDAASILPDEIILELLDHLPDFFLAQVADQIDPWQFEHYLMYQQQNLLYYLGGNAEAA